MESSFPKSYVFKCGHTHVKICVLFGHHYDVMIPNYNDWVVDFWSLTSFEIINSTLSRTQNVHTFD